MRGCLAIFLCMSMCLLPATGVRAESELSLYSGIQIAPHSRVRGTDPGGLGDFSFLATWEGRSLEPPPYYGMRYTYWSGEKFGFGVEFNHAKVYADDATLANNGFTRLEFSDGLNVLTANAYRRWPQAFLNGRVTPYVGGGVGLSIPNVEVLTPGGYTFQYQVTGPAVTWMAGAKYSLNDRWGLFGEYKGSYSQNDTDLSNGGTLSTNVVTNAINLGVSFSF